MAEWIAACQADDVDPEDVIPFEHDGQDYAIYRSPGDEYYATDGHCTHEQTLLCDGLVMGRVIECPKHNGRFDYVSGKALGAPVYPSLWAAYREIIPAVLRQLRDQEYYVRRELLPGAAPFNEPTPLNDGRALPLPAATAA